MIINAMVSLVFRFHDGRLEFRHKTHPKMTFGSGSGQNRIIMVVHGSYPHSWHGPAPFRLVSLNAKQCIFEVFISFLETFLA